MNKFQLKKRIILGSANFTQKYGADSTKVKSNEVKKILNFAKKNNIYKIDTAEGYLKDKQIFKNVDKKLKITSKIITNYKWASAEYCLKRLESHFKNLNTNKIETLLLHDPKILFTQNGLKVFRNLENLKNKKYFSKIGMSIYDTDQLDYLTSEFNIDIIQCPYNILNKKILSSGWFDRLKNLGLKIHVRSLFLQGLLVNKSIYKKKYFKRWEKKFSRWFLALEDNNISPIDYCLSDIMNYDFDGIVIGINSLDNFKEILNFRKINIDKIYNLKINDLKLIDPRKWN